MGKIKQQEKALLGRKVKLKVGNAQKCPKTGPPWKVKAKAFMGKKKTKPNPPDSRALPGSEEAEVGSCPQTTSPAPPATACLPAILPACYFTYFTGCSAHMP